MILQASKSADLLKVRGSSKSQEYTPRVLCLYPLPDLIQAFQEVFLRVWRESENFILSFLACSCPIPLSLINLSFSKDNQENALVT